MRRLSWPSILAWLVAAFFLVGAIGNAFPSEGIAADYARWGYPDWFHYVTALLELAAALLLAYRPTRLAGAGVGSLVMLAAAATTLFHGEASHAIAPLVVLGLTVLVGVLERRRSDQATPAGSRS